MPNTTKFKQKNRLEIILIIIIAIAAGQKIYEIIKFTHEFQALPFNIYIKAYHTLQKKLKCHQKL